MEDSNYEDFKRYLSIQNNKVRNNITEVKASELDIPYMLHIDIKLPSKLIPMMPRRAATSEDNTIPRVTVADTLLGCIIGYASALQDFFNEGNHGYYISAYDFDYCIKPNEKLVYDAAITNEHWLIGYNRKSLSYKAREIGKFFFDEILTRKELYNNKPFPAIKKATIIVEVNERMKFNSSIILEKGFYKITATNKDFINNTAFDDKNGFEIESLSRGEYMKYKSVSASMLSHDTEKTPLYHNW